MDQVESSAAIESVTKHDGDLSEPDVGGDAEGGHGNTPPKSSWPTSPRLSSEATTTSSTSNPTADTTTDTTTDTTMGLEGDNMKLRRDPQLTTIELTSTVSTASAFGESLRFSTSPSGFWLVVFSSSVLYILRTKDIPSINAKAYRIRRKPLDVAMTDSGCLAVLSNLHQIDVYDLELCHDGGDNGLSGQVSRTHTFNPGNPTHTVAMDPKGQILAAGHREGIELFDLETSTTNASESHSRSRQFRCEPMDHLTFSSDGRFLLATSAARRNRPSTILSVSHAYDAAFTEEEEAEDGSVETASPVNKAWLTQLLFPESIKGARQAMLLPDPSDRHIEQLFAFDVDQDAFGIYDISQKSFLDVKMQLPNSYRYGRAELLEDAPPVVSSDGRHVAFGVKAQAGTTVQIYGMPEAWAGGNVPLPSALKQIIERRGSHLAPYACPQLPREESNVLESIRKLQWLESEEPASKRLLALIDAVKSKVPSEGLVPNPIAPSGRIAIIDFSPDIGSTSMKSPQKLSVNLDDGQELLSLPDTEPDFERAVELERTRTLAQRRHPQGGPEQGGVRSPTRSSTIARDGFPGVVPVRGLAPRLGERRRSSATEMEIAFYEPYTHGQPRSQASLHRAATVAASSPANRRHLRALPTQTLEYRRADGRRDPPHESDADNWVPPPPPYTLLPEPPVPGGPRLLAISRPPLAPVLPAQAPVVNLPIRYSAAQQGMAERSVGGVLGPEAERILASAAPPPSMRPLDRTHISDYLPDSRSLLPPLPPSERGAARRGPPGPGQLNNSMTFPPRRQPSVPRRGGAQGSRLVPPQTTAGMLPATAPTSPTAQVEPIFPNQSMVSLPTAEQLENLNRRSSDMNPPRAALGANRRASYAGMMQSPVAQAVERGSRRPRFSRLNTIQSVTSHRAGSPSVHAQAQEPPKDAGVAAGGRFRLKDFRCAVM